MLYDDNFNGIYGDPLNIPTLPTKPISPVYSTTTSTPVIPSYVPTTPTANGGKAVKWEVVQYWFEKGADWAVSLWKQRQAAKQTTYNGSGINPNGGYTPPYVAPKKDNTMLIVGGLGIILLAMNKKKKA